MLTKWHEDGRSIMWISVAKWKKVDHLEISWTSYSPPQASNFIKRVKKDLATPPRGHVTGPVALNFACLFVPFQGLMQVLNVYCNCWTRTLISHVDSVQRDHSTIKRAVPPPPPPPPSTTTISTTRKHGTTCRNFLSKHTLCVQHCYHSFPMAIHHGGCGEFRDVLVLLMLES